MCAEVNFMSNYWKNLKLVQKLKSINPKSMWLNFTSSQKSHRKDYVEMLTSSQELETLTDERRLEAMVRQQIKMEFPNIENSSTFEILVDAVVHNIKKKQLRSTDDIQFE